MAFPTHSALSVVVLAVWGLATGALAQAPDEPSAEEADGPLQGALDSPSAGIAGCAPPQLFRATIRNVSPGIAASDRAAQPRQLWRLGDKHLRSEEAPDPVRGDQAIVIISEPDVWTYNRAAGEGRHAIDPGPDLTVRAPILPPVAGLPEALRGLEYGCEPAFVAAYAPEAQRVVPWGAAQASVHTVTMGEHSVAVLMDTRRNAPLMLSYLLRGQPRLVLRYDDYRQGLPERPGLFEPPKGVAMSEPGAEAPPRRLDPAR